MRPETRDYLAQRLNEARRGIVRPKVMGINRGVTTCSHCGKSGLDKTVEVRMPDGAVSYFGSECADHLRDAYDQNATNASANDSLIDQANFQANLRRQAKIAQIQANASATGTSGADDEYEDDDADDDGADDDGADDDTEDDDTDDPDVDPEASVTARYTQDYGANFGKRYSADPLPHAESPLSIDNFDKRFQICDVIFDAEHGRGSTGNNANIRYMGFGALMVPKKFLSLAMRLNGVYDASIKHLIEKKRDPGWGPPMLYVDFDTGTVTGHEGRHRVTAFATECKNQPIIVHVIPRSATKQMRAHDINKDMLKKANRGLFPEEFYNLTDTEKSDPNTKKRLFVEGPVFRTVFLQNQQIDL